LENPEGERQLGKYRYRWEDIQMNLKEIVYEDVDWIHVA
jgi:hypothetical protein